MIGRGCLLLKYLSLAWCERIDDAVAEVLCRCFPEHTKLDLCETLVSPTGQGQNWKKQGEQLPVEIRVNSKYVKESSAALINDQFPQLEVLFWNVEEDRAR